MDLYGYPIFEKWLMIKIFSFISLHPKYLDTETPNSIDLDLEFDQCLYYLLRPVCSNIYCKYSKFD